MHQDPWFDIIGAVVRYKKEHGELPSVDSEDIMTRRIAKWLNSQMGIFHDLPDNKKVMLLELINII